MAFKENTFVIIILRIWRQWKISAYYFDECFFSFVVWYYINFSHDKFSCCWGQRLFQNKNVSSKASGILAVSWSTLIYHHMAYIILLWSIQRYLFWWLSTHLCFTEQTSNDILPLDTLDGKKQFCNILSMRNFGILTRSMFFIYRMKKANQFDALLWNITIWSTYFYFFNKAKQ